jgi:hypothetical protein
LAATWHQSSRQVSAAVHSHLHSGAKLSRTSLLVLWLTIVLTRAGKIAVVRYWKSRTLDYIRANGLTILWLNFQSKILLLSSWGNKCIHACMHRPACIRTGKPTYINTHENVGLHKYINTCTYIHRHTYTHTYTYIHTHIHAYVHIYIQACIYSYIYT